MLAAWMCYSVEHILRQNIVEKNILNHCVYFHFNNNIESKFAYSKKKKMMKIFNFREEGPSITFYLFLWKNLYRFLWLLISIPAFYSTDFFHNIVYWNLGFFCTEKHEHNSLLNGFLKRLHPRLLCQNWVRRHWKRRSKFNNKHFMILERRPSTKERILKHFIHSFN